MAPSATVCTAGSRSEMVCVSGKAIESYARSSKERMQHQVQMDESRATSCDPTESTMLRFEIPSMLRSSRSDPARIFHSISKSVDASRPGDMPEGKQRSHTHPRLGWGEGLGGQDALMSASNICRLQCAIETQHGPRQSSWLNDHSTNSTEGQLNAQPTLASGVVEGELTASLQPSGLCSHISPLAAQHHSALRVEASVDNARASIAIARATRSELARRVTHPSVDLMVSLRQLHWQLLDVKRHLDLCHRRRYRRSLLLGHLSQGKSYFRDHTLLWRQYISESRSNRALQVPEQAVFQDGVRDRRRYLRFFRSWRIGLEQKKTDLTSLVHFNSIHVKEAYLVRDQMTQPDASVADVRLQYPGKRPRCSMSSLDAKAISGILTCEAFKRHGHLDLQKPGVTHQGLRPRLDSVRQICGSTQRVLHSEERGLVSWLTKWMIIEREHRLSVSALWTDIEKLVYLDKFVQYPKNFSRISAFLSKKRPRDCVRFYYDSKKQVDYKGLLKEHQQRRRGKGTCWKSTQQAVRTFGGDLVNDPHGSILSFHLPMASASCSFHALSWGPLKDGYSEHLDTLRPSLSCPRTSACPRIVGQFSETCSLDDLRYDYSAQKSTLSRTTHIESALSSQGGQHSIEVDRLRSCRSLRARNSHEELKMRVQEARRKSVTFRNNDTLMYVERYDKLHTTASAISAKLECAQLQKPRLSLGVCSDRNKLERSVFQITRVSPSLCGSFVHDINSLSATWPESISVFTHDASPSDITLFERSCFLRCILVFGSKSDVGLELFPTKTMSKMSWFGSEYHNHIGLHGMRLLDIDYTEVKCTGPTYPETLSTKSSSCC